MIILYTSPGCRCCNKARKFLDDNALPYIEKSIFSRKLKRDEIAYLFKRSSNGTDDIISRRSHLVKDSDLKIDDMHLSELISYIMNNRSLLKRPILINENYLSIGYDPDELSVFKRRK
ncbi:MAG: Spx/MgsR family RNA polymerase-binding regulatory protein [Erysipelotrichaceae bacterium]|jgi:regulatory protein spx|nr:Spx/MgsR family RNA polymerase-binding regulatory protein [Erysipelotrichaceae bacterium]